MKEYFDKGVYIYGGLEDFLVICWKDMIDRKMVDDMLFVIMVICFGMWDNFLDKGFFCMDSFFVIINKLGEVVNFCVIFSICCLFGKEIN